MDNLGKKVKTTIPKEINTVEEAEALFRQVFISKERSDLLKRFDEERESLLSLHGVPYIPMPPSIDVISGRSYFFSCQGVDWTCYVGNEKEEIQPIEDLLVEIFSTPYSEIQNNLERICPIGHEVMETRGVDKCYIGVYSENLIHPNIYVLKDKV